MKRHQPGIRLQLLVSGSIVLGMLMLATSVIFHTHQSNRRILIDLAQKNAQQIATKIGGQIDKQTQPVITALRLLSLDTLVLSRTHAERMARIRFMKTILESNPVLSSVYLGYQDGDFFLLRKLSKGKVRQRVDAPANAHFMVQSIERNESGDIQSSQWLYFDSAFHLLKRRSMPDYQYDPRNRHWFAQALSSADLVIEEPYVFYTTQLVGVTLSLRAQSEQTVIGMDVSIADISEQMRAFSPDRVNQTVLIDDNNMVIAYPTASKVIHRNENGVLRLAQVNELGVPIFNRLTKQTVPSKGLELYATKDGSWFGQTLFVGPEGQGYWRLLYAIPESYLLQKANDVMREQLIWSAGMMLVLLFIGWKIGALVVQPMKRLSGMIDRMTTFNFSSTRVITSHVKEVNTLSRLLHDMAEVIKRFLSISILLSQERDLDKMLHGVVNDLAAITSSNAACIYLYESDQSRLVKATEDRPWGPEVIHYDSHQHEDISQCCRAQFKASEALMCMPLHDRRSNIIGVLILSVNHQDYLANPGFLTFVADISGAAATAIETRKQVEAQEALIEAIVRLLADAIDAKSPYTGGHCERVPMLAEMIIDEAQREQGGVFADFSMDEVQRREFNIAAWLHDCGKITSREYVIDKATKLETIYNRIHEIRTRFEVVWRDVDIDYWQGIATGRDKTELDAMRQKQHQQLIDDYALIAQLNIGSEDVRDEDIARLRLISQRTWVRHFSARIGLSRDECARLHGEEVLPVTEQLLDDKNEHIVPWNGKIPPVEKGHPDNQWGFDMILPKNEMNLGEIYNLSIQHGTLTEEERFLVNDHIVQTIKMLSKLPFPDEMKNVPDIAGNHHEKVDGTGYPRKLNGDQLTIPEKVMALSDVFEALTAKDRPYKDAKTLSEALSILAKMVKLKHIDEQVFRLFIERKIYQTYAEQYLMDKQKDHVDIAAIMAEAGICDA